MFGQQSRLRQWLSTNTSKNRVDCSEPFLIDAKHRLKNLKNWIDFEVSTIFLPRLERVFEFISFQHTKNLTNLFITIWRHELLSLIKYSGSLQSLINLNFCNYISLMRYWGIFMKLYYALIPFWSIVEQVGLKNESSWSFQ